MAKKQHTNDDDEESNEKFGHNISGKFSPERLKVFIERVEKLEEDKRATGTDIRSVYQEASGEGFDAKVLRKIVADRRKDAEVVAEQEELKRIYKEALGDFSSSPLGAAAIEKAA